MSATAPRPSRFWGTTPRRIKWLVQILFVLWVGAVIAIGVLPLRDYIWKLDAACFAGQAGGNDAKMYYAHGSRRLLKIATIDESGKADMARIPSIREMVPTGPQADGFDIYSYYVSPSGGSPERFTGEIYVKEFNHWMRTICANPDWFGPNGERLPDTAGMKRAPFQRVPE